MTHKPKPKHKKPCPAGHEIYNVGSPFLSISIITVYIVWSMPGSREEDFKRNNAFSLNDLYDHTPVQDRLPLG